MTESAFLKERDSGKPREIDILIELPVAGSVLRMAVECRDRSRPADVDWIDKLIGKYRDLSVHSVVAVSRTGFTSTAKEKAISTNIETRTLVEALAADWAKTFLDVAIARISADLKPLTFQLATEPPWPDERQPVAIRTDGVPITPDDWLRNALITMRNQVPDLVRDRLGGDWRALAAPERNIEVEWGVTTPNTIFTSAAGIEHRLHDVTIRCKVIFGHEWLPVKRQTFGDAGIATAVDTTNPADPVAVMLVQRPGSQPGEPVIFRPKSAHD